MELWEEDLYELLGVSSEAAPDEIKKAYKKLAVKLHPDRFPDDEAARADATARFGKITNAYNILTNEEERAEYDFARRMGFAADGPAAAPAADSAAVNEIKKSQARNQFDQGRVYHRAKNVAKAIGCYKEAIRLDPADADYHAHLGLAYQEQGLKTPASKAFAAAAKLDRNNALVRKFHTPAGKPAPKGKAAPAKKGAPGAKGKAAAGGGLLDQIKALYEKLNQPIGGSNGKAKR